MIRDFFIPNGPFFSCALAPIRLAVDRLSDVSPHASHCNPSPNSPRCLDLRRADASQAAVAGENDEIFSWIYPKLQNHTEI